jgi:hypothetical protein
LELCFGRKPFVSHFRPFGCKCFVQKCGNLYKFELCDVIFDETAPCPYDVDECAGDNEMEESIFIDEELQGFDGDEGDPLHPSTSSSKPVPTSTPEAKAPHATTSPTAVVEASRVEGEIISKSGAPSHIQKAHPPEQIIGNLN